MTGTWGADGTAYFWDVTDPGNVFKIDSIKVDARTVNDVKVSEDGTICVLSREGASNRKNGIVILDVKNPRDVKEISVFTENLTGGVHNVFIDKGIVYAPDYLINAGGVMNCYAEIHGINNKKVMEMAGEIYNTTLDILNKSKKENIPTSLAANKIAEKRINMELEKRTN